MCRECVHESALVHHQLVLGLLAQRGEIAELLRIDPPLGALREHLDLFHLERGQGSGEWDEELVTGEARSLRPTPSCEG